ncbi:hypothetical protein BXZ70DRAFT_1008580 [Cristinia sonorae]|uniref:F-box domain-containing protein n=1 Tax=Cristinia sonorae TaxID=1940300 RepID=A0A8K0UNC4_9AGAR|nr:hypothetical protein BXZ70DRAFT_1008580 [Cristinia sonorae]
MSAIDLRRTQLQQQIDQRIHELCNVNAHRNSLQLVARLPTELWANIFLELAALSSPCDPSDHAGRNPYSWIPCVTHVFRQWREIALATPQLWTDIYMKTTVSLERVQAFLDRSKHSLLRIDAHMRAYENNLVWMGTLRSVVQQIARAETLTMTPYFSPDWLAADFPRLAPHLRTLTILHPPEVILGPDQPHPLFEFFQKCTTPNLTTLVLNGYNLHISMKGLLPPSLTSLTVDNHERRIPFSHFMMVIADLPELRVLKLAGTTEAPRNTTFLSPIGTERVDFPRMEILSLSENIFPGFQFLDKCTFPSSVRITLSLSRRWSQILSHQMALLASPLSRHLDAIFGNTTRGSETLSLSPREICFLERIKEPLVRLSLPGSFDCIVAIVLLRLPLHYFTTLELSGLSKDNKPLFSESTITRVLTAMPNVKTLVFRDRCIGALAIALLSPQEQTVEAPLTGPPFLIPGLRTVVLQDMCVSGLEHPWVDDPQDPFIASLCGIIRHRRETVGVSAIKKLVFKKCIFLDSTDSHFKALKEEVQVSGVASCFLFGILNMITKSHYISI